jgi:hypothetical protein
MSPWPAVTGTANFPVTLPGLKTRTFEPGVHQISDEVAAIIRARP